LREKKQENKQLVTGQSLFFLFFLYQQDEVKTFKLTNEVLDRFAFAGLSMCLP